MNRVVASSVALLALAIVAAGGARLGEPASGSAMALAAQRFVDSLSPEQRSKAVFAYDGKERKDWHFVPRDRPGLLLKEMSDTQRARAHDLIRAAFSSQGYLKATSIMELDRVLHEMEAAAGGSGAGRDPELYSFAVFGNPSRRDQPWGWKVEGHHLSLNLSAPTREALATTPAFMGAHPALVEQGRSAGLRVLAAEDDLARELLSSFDEGQRKQATFTDVAPRDIVLGPGRPPEFGDPVGLPAAAMNDGQRATLWRLIEEYAKNLKGDLAEWHLARIRAAGLEKLRFAWAGSATPGQGHYYRIVGPTFIVEFDNTQDHASHIHTVWRDPEHDFGDPLREHLARDHGPEPGP